VINDNRVHASLGLSSPQNQLHLEEPSRARVSSLSSGVRRASVVCVFESGCRPQCGESTLPAFTTQSKIREGLPAQGLRGKLASRGSAAWWLVRCQPPIQSKPIRQPSRP
jgi:hypothetical protein